MTRAPWVTHFGFTRTPFSKSIPAKDLLERASHQEAVARIRFCIAESSLGVVTGEVGVGKTVAARTAVAGLDPVRHTIVYLPNPASASGACAPRSSARSAATPLPQGRPGRPGR
jgi:type II secretory pathway predicted ATPase ExeA